MTLTAEQIERLAEPVYEAYRLGKYGAQEYLPMWHELDPKPTSTPEIEVLTDVVAALIAEAVEQARADIAAAMTEEMADRVEWGDGTGYINTADAARIARGEVTP